MALVVHDSRTRRKEVFEPLVPGHVNMYVCGPTVYDHPHLGHARAAVAFDIVRRTLEAVGNRVTYVQNITDVDDKIINRAAEENSSPWEIAERFTRSYEDQMRRIGVRAPTITPRATGHITDMLELISRLIDAGVAYAVEDGDVYFAVEKFEGYGSLSNRSLDDMRAGERVEPDPRKRNPLDFALWKGAKPGEVSWPSPWGAGRPGWHIECSAMSTKYLGDTFDIHGGGQDLLFPHHENETAQTEAATGKPFVRYWLHNGFITVNAEKMSKSLKNFTTLSDVLGSVPPPVVRLAFVGAHYRSQLELTPETWVEARAVWDRFAAFERNAAELATATSDAGKEFRERFIASMEDDFNTPGALAVLHELLNEANPLIDRAEAGDDPAKLSGLYRTFIECTGVLGLDPHSEWSTTRAHQRVAGLVEFLLEQRIDARAVKDFARADAIRDALTAAGVVVEDRAKGARWYLEDPWSE